MIRTIGTVYTQQGTGFKVIFKQGLGMQGASSHQGPPHLWGLTTLGNLSYSMATGTTLSHMISRNVWFWDLFSQLFPKETNQWRDLTGWLKTHWNYGDVLTGSIKGQLSKWQRHRTAVLGLQSVLKSCLKDAMNVLTKYLPSASIFCHQINHPLCLHDLYKGGKWQWHRWQAPGREPVLYRGLHSGEGTGAIVTKGSQETFTASES